MLGDLENKRSDAPFPSLLPDSQPLRIVTPAPAAPTPIPHTDYSPISLDPHQDFAPPRDIAPRMEAKQFMRLVWADKDTRRLFIYLAMTAVFFLLELFTSYSAHDHAPISEMSHTGLDLLMCAGLLWLMVYVKRMPSEDYPYGYDRMEVLAGFVSASFLVFFSFFIMGESVHHLSRHQTQHTHVGFSVDHLRVFLLLFGLVCFFRKAYLSFLKNRQELAYPVGRGRELCVHGLFLHILGDVTIVAGDLVNHHSGLSFHYAAVETLCAWVSACLVLWMAWPLFKQSGMLLLQTTPKHTKDKIDRCVREISTYSGVLECRSEHWWSLSPGVVVGSLHVRIRCDANEQAVLCYAHKLLSKHVKYLTVQVDREPELDFFQLAKGAGKQ